MTREYKHLVISNRRAVATMNEFAKQGWRVISFVEDQNGNARILLEKETS